MSDLPLFHTRLQPEWIDFNGHLRDAYYGLVMSYAVDEVMDHLGMHAAYRDRTRCTLYTLEWHMHYLKEVKGSDSLAVESRILAVDRKRIHLGCRFLSGDAHTTAATGDAMLLHVRQADQPASVPFPPDIMGRLEALRLPSETSAAWGPKSRTIELRRRAGPAGIAP